MIDQQRQRPIDYRAEVSTGQRMSRERLRALQFLVCLARQRHLHHVEFGREWCYHSQPADDRRRGRARVHGRDQLEDPLLAPVPRCGQHFGVIFQREMRREQADGTQRELTSFERPEYLRIAACRASGFDTVVRRTLRQM
jgi:hypothetical protein